MAYSPRITRILQLGAVSIIAVATAGCASHARGYRSGYDEFDSSRWSSYDSGYYEGNAASRRDNRTSGYSVRGIASARNAHRQYSSDRAEQLDGDCERRVTIRSGETLSDLAEFCDVSVQSILDANPRIRNLRNISAGDRFYIPEQHADIYRGEPNERMRSYGPYRTSEEYYDQFNSDSHTRDRHNYHLVRRGDTLGDIAARYNVSLSDLVDQNRDIRPRNLDVGDRIYLPGYARTYGLRNRIEGDLSDRRRPAVSFSPARGPRNGEIRLSGTNFERGEKLSVLYGDRREQLLQIRTIEADQSGRINEILRLPDAYAGHEAYFAIKRGSDTFLTDNAYAVDYGIGGHPDATNGSHTYFPGPLELSGERQLAPVLRAAVREVYRDDTVSLSANGFPPNTPVSIYGGPSRDRLTKLSEIRTGPTGLFQTSVPVPENLSGDTVLFVAAVEDGARTYFTERVRVRSDSRGQYERGDATPEFTNRGNEIRSLGQPESEPTTLDRGVRQMSGGPALLSRFRKGSNLGAFDINAGGQGAISGVLTNEGQRCPTIRDDTGRIFTLLGDLGRFGDGDRVLIRGSASADNRICKQSDTIQIFAIEEAPW